MAFANTTRVIGTGSSSFLGSRVNINPARLAPRRVSVFQPIQAGYGQRKKVGPGRHWEHYDLTPNGKPVRIKVHVKKGDTVQVIAGKDKGKVSIVAKVNSKTGDIIVEGVNVKTKHISPKTSAETGQIKQIEAAFHHSNVMLYSKEKQVRSRVGHKMTEEGKKVRYLIKTGEIIDK